MRERFEQGTVLDDRYTLDRRIGSGGMADVWCAQDAQLGREVALKILHENFARDTEFVERFRREASSAAGLQHPNVVGVFDRGDVGGTYYIAMELVEGSSLRELIESGITIGEAVEVTRQILSAAQFAHERGIVHRDLKPLNVLIDPGGRVRVTDFGIARAGGSEITRTGSVMGTAQYLSPEQAQGMDVTASSDVYSIGVMLLEMLTGRVPFDGENAIAIAMKQVSEPAPAPSSINPAVPAALDAVVLRALAKDPAERFASAKEMLEALDAAEADPQVAGSYPAAPIVPTRTRKWWWIAALAALLLIAGLAFALTRDGGVKVPGVTGDQETAAKLRLQRAGFEVDVDRIERDTPEGTVIEQDPRGGTEADEASTVTLVVSLGPGATAVPDVSGLRSGQAQKRLKRQGFETDVERVSDESVPPNRVIETSPEAGTQLAAGETVTLVVSQGSQSASVPDVVGLDRIDAKAALEDEGFLVDAEPENSDEPEDQVIRQIPPAGTSLEAGGKVTIVYSNGAGTITLENFVGQEQGFAERKLSGQGLNVSVRTQTVDDASDDGIVLSQSPDSGSRLSPGDRVSLVVGEFTAPSEPTNPGAGPGSGGGGGGGGGGGQGQGQGAP